SVYNWTNVVDIHSGKAKPGNPYLTPILDELKKNENVELKIIDIPYANLLGINKIGEKINAGYDVFESYYSSESGKRFHKMQNEVLKKWSSMRKLDSFRNSFIFQGINIWALVEPQFNCYFSTRLEAHARDFETIKEMIDAENPELVMYSSDIDEFGRMLFYLCSQRSIPTVAVQHGTLPKTIPLFIYKKFELKNKYTAPPLPTKLVVYGEYYKDFFSKLGNYPEEKIAVCGNQRYDYYLIMREKHTKDELCRELSLAPGKKTIALLTQPLPLIKEREEILDSVCRAVREIPNSQLIIKLHPAESSEVMHRRIARQNKLRDFIVVKDIDNFKIMHICDALIGPVSTLDYEAMLLEKPVIVLNLKKAPEEIPFVKEGSAIGVYEQEKIARALRNVLFDDELVRNLKSNMRKTVRRHLFRNDGKASGRIASVALKLLRL
ncbi:MAG TPA: UDP-N-acetylglucosamine 2-epimerase, partial [Candidatus Nanoarchaeia archaeon]|nr:UDP-N-acetylglucosamine 2-epimerase [Candidatus Nanoarchaeia archaeon]